MDDSVYINFIEKNLPCKSRQNWIDRQYTSDGQLSEYVADFFILKYDQKYLGILESERPNSATYLYDFPNNNIQFYSYIYRIHLAEPYITRDANTRYIYRVKCINLLLKLKNILQKKNEILLTEEEQCLLKHIADDYIEFEKDNIKSVNNVLENLIGLKAWTPIKYRNYFVGDIDHYKDVNKWSIELEDMIAKHIAGDYRKKEYKYYINSENEWDVFLAKFPQVVEDNEYIIIEKEIEDNYKKRNKITNKEQDDSTNKKASNLNAGKRVKEKKAEDKDKSNSIIDLYNKSIQYIAYKYHVSPHSLLSMIQHRITSVKVESIEDILTPEQVTLCKRIFDELEVINNKKK